MGVQGARVGTVVKRPLGILAEWSMFKASRERLCRFFKANPGTRRRRRRQDTRNRVFVSRLEIRDHQGGQGSWKSSDRPRAADQRRGPVQVSAAAAQSNWTALLLDLSPGASQSLLIPNAGGTSARSEALSIHILEVAFGASGVLCEMEVTYDGYPWCMVDYLCTVKGDRIGVSVFRAMVAPCKKRCEFSMEDAQRLVRKKLHGLIVARNSISKEHRFHKCILHCIAQSPKAGRMMEAALREALPQFEPELAAVITVVRHADCIFYEPHRRTPDQTAAQAKA